MGDVDRPPADHNPGWRRYNAYNTASGDGTVFSVQDGDIVLSGQPDAPRPASGRAPSTGGRFCVLMLAANPQSTPRLAIDEEARQIAERLRLSRDRDRFDLVTCWAVRPVDLLQYLNQYRPHIVHFSGHGDRAGEIRLSVGDGSDQPVAAPALAELFRVTGDQIRVVVLNACYSAAQVRAIGRHVDYIVGMTAPITDEAATIFAASFYSALGFGRTIPHAFEQAVAALGLHGLADHRVPELVARPDANPQLMVRD